MIDTEEWVRFSSIQAGQLYMLNLPERFTSGTCGKMSLVPNGGSGNSRMLCLDKKNFTTPFVVHVEHLVQKKGRNPAVLNA